MAAATVHPECLSGRISEISDDHATVEIDLNVEMPLHMKAQGGSENGVRCTETVQAVLNSSYPWEPPTFYLRSDFPRELPHLQPGAPDSLPRPCLVDGDHREYFLQFDLVEAGIFHFLHQLVFWLQRAAEGTLISQNQGWEPTLRHGIRDIIVLDAEFCRSLVNDRGGQCVFKARYGRSGPLNARLLNGTEAIIEVSYDRVPLNPRDMTLFTAEGREKLYFGNTVCCVVWPDKLPNGLPFVANSYLPETVTNLDALRRRAGELRCGRGLQAVFNGLEHYFRRRNPDVPVPIAIVLCARRPFNLMGSESNIELLPYVVELRAAPGRSSLFAGQGEEPVAPTIQLNVANPTLLRNVSGAPETGAVSILGCGSVGSKITMHLARCGIAIAAVCDQKRLTPHNLARHALARSSLAGSKASELAHELSYLGQTPKVEEEDIVIELNSTKGRQVLLPKEATISVNTTASLSVREALSRLSSEEVDPRLAEVALFGRGHGGFLLVEGQDHNPTLADLIAELYAIAPPGRVRNLLFDPELGLAEIQIGQGCGSLTMPMTDMRVSAMTASLTESLMDIMQIDDVSGQIVIGFTAEGSRDTQWFQQAVAPFKVVPILGSHGWHLRVSQRVIDKIRMEVDECSDVETGGVLIGTSSARLQTVHIVDVLPAPPDSVRTATEFTLGTHGLQKTISSYCSKRGDSVYDVGTWHSHLSEEGPSPRDWRTAQELSAQRPPPSVLLIVTPSQFHSLMGEGRAP